MDTLTVSSKGQITVPKHLREQLELRAGAKVMVTVDAQRRLVLTPALIEPDELFAPDAMCVQPFGASRARTRARTSSESQIAR